MKNSLWIFGDSFSDRYGQPLDLKRSQWQEILKERDDNLIVWQDIVSKELNLINQDHGVGGNSSPHILFKVIEKLHWIEEGDYVSIGLSYPSRDYMKKHVAEELGIWSKDTIKEPIVSSGPIVSDDKHKEKLWNSFLVEFRDEGPSLDTYYMMLGQSLKTELNIRGVKCIVWDHTEWSKYEGYVGYTQGLSQDNHWSPKGHRDFAGYVLNEFKEKRLI